jgi:hypothetical protein
LVDDIHYTRNLLSQGDDGLWYVNYLRAVRDELDEPEAYPELLIAHRSVILSRAGSGRKSPRVIHKLLWLARYNNSVCESVGRLDLAVGQIAMPEQRLS